MRLIFIIQVFSYLLRRYSFLFYRGKLLIILVSTKQYPINVCIKMRDNNEK
nr:MAG TPA: hypothetical protein [Crassvirales sp.]